MGYEGHMRRRDVITLIGVAARWPLAARAQQTAMQMVRRINDTTMNLSAVRVNAGRRRFDGR